MVVIALVGACQRTILFFKQHFFTLFAPFHIFTYGISLGIIVSLPSNRICLSRGRPCKHIVFSPDNRYAKNKPILYSVVIVWPHINILYVCEE